MCCSSFCWLQKSPCFLGGWKLLSQTSLGTHENEGTTSWITGVVRWTRRAELKIHRLMAKPMKTVGKQCDTVIHWGYPPPTHYSHFYEGPPINLHFALLVGRGYPEVIHFLSYTPGSTNMAGKWARIEDVFPIVKADIPASYVSLPGGMSKLADLGHCFHPLKWGVESQGLLSSNQVNRDIPVHCELWPSSPFLLGILSIQQLEPGN